MGQLLGLPAPLGVELHLEELAISLITPTAVDPFILVIFPAIATNFYLVALAFKATVYLPYAVRIAIFREEVRVADSVRNVGCQVCRLGPRFIGDQLREFLLEAVSALEGELLGLGYQVSMFELSLDPAHRRRQARVPVGSENCPPFSGAAPAQHLLGDLALARLQPLTFPLPRA